MLNVKHHKEVNSCRTTEPSEKDWPLKITTPNLISNPWILSATLSLKLLFKLKKKTSGTEKWLSSQAALPPLDSTHSKNVFLQGSKNLSHCHHSNSEDLISLPWQPFSYLPPTLIFFSSIGIPGFFHHFSHDLILCSLQFSIFLIKVYI